MSHAWTHSWCKSPSRDEAVRAAEDNRPGPLPTLEECIGEPFADSPGASETDRLRADADFLLRLANDQTKDFGELLSVVGNIDARVERLEGMMAKTGSASSAVEHENKGDDMGTKANDQAAAYRFEERRLEAESRRKADIRSGSTWFPASEQPAPAPPAASGLRTELEPSVARVTLEFSGRLRTPPSQWPWDLILSGACLVRSEPGESVRVVDTHAQAVADSVAWEGARDAYRGRIARLTDERDAAVRERNEAIRDLRSVTAERAKLEEQLESVADRAAAAETALEAAPAASVVPDVVSEMTEIIRSPTNDPDSKHEALATLVEAVCPGWRLAPAASGNGQAILDGSPAASGAAGNSPGSPVSSEPVAWMCEWTDHTALYDSLAIAEVDADGQIVPQPLYRTPPQPASGAAGTEPVAWCVMSSADTPHRVGLHWDQWSADRWARVKQSEYTTKLVVAPLYAAPQPAKGWLTVEEREAVLWLAEFAGQRCGLPWPCGMGGSFPVVAHRLLARSSPPEVVLRSEAHSIIYADNKNTNRVFRAKDVIEALAAIGVSVKEVG